MSYLIGFFILAFIFSNPGGFFKFLFGLGVLVILGWLAFAYTAFFFAVAAGLFVFFAALGGLLQWLLIRKVKKFLRDDNLRGLGIFFQDKSVGDKKIIADFIAKSEGGGELLKYFFVRDFFKFASERGGGDVIIFERSDYDDYARSVWLSSLLDFNRIILGSEFERFYPGWRVTTLAPVDHKTKKKVDLLKLERLGSTSATMVIDMDDD